MMKNSGRTRHIIYLATLFLLFVSGFGQLPIFKRYYIADIPGLAWTNQFYVTHAIHYVAASVLIMLVFYVLVDFMLKGFRVGQISITGFVKAVLILLLMISGGLLVINNLPGVFLPQNGIIALDLIHMGVCMILLLAGGISLFIKKSWVKV